MNVEERKEEGTAFTYIDTGSRAVCFMLPGASYSYDRPLFYYSTMLMLEEERDVVHIHYSYSTEVRKREDLAEIMASDINKVIRKVLSERGYESIILMGKSMGTLPLIQILAGQYPNADIIVLTPLLNREGIFNGLSEMKNRTLSVIGDQDPHFSKEKVEKLKAHPGRKWAVLHDADHSLEHVPFSTNQSMKNILRIMNEIRTFLKAKG